MKSIVLSSSQKKLVGQNTNNYMNIHSPSPNNALVSPLTIRVVENDCQFWRMKMMYLMEKFSKSLICLTARQTFK